MPSACTFQFNSPGLSYSTGETIDGTIILQLASQKSVIDLYVTLNGEGKVSWEEQLEKTREDGTKFTETIVHSSEEVYVRSRQTLNGPGNLGPGEFSFPFSLSLPSNCCSSFEGQYGWRRYHLSVVLRKTGQNRQFFKFIKVVRRDDLNLNPLHRLPLQTEEIKSFCCTKGKLLLTLTIPWGAYVGGQYLQYSLRLQNHSMGDIKGYRIGILQHNTYLARTPQYSQRSASCEVFRKNSENICLRLSTRLFEEQIRVPVVTPTTNETGIIKTRYQMYIKVNTGGCTVDPVLLVPLHIGTVPLRDTLLMEPQPLTDTTPSAPDLLSRSTKEDNPPTYDGFKPPSFDESTASSAPPLEDGGQMKHDLAKEV